MKKLMLTAAVAAVAAGAFADDPTVYSYSASVTHMYAKLVKVQNKVTKTQVDVYQKFKKTTTLNGYLIQDVWGATSPYLGDGAFSNAPVYDQGRNRAFLVVYNSGAEADVRAPKILPAVLEAKWFDQKFTHDDRGTTTISDGIAEGTLFVGGQLINASYQASHTNVNAYAAVVPVRPKLDLDADYLNYPLFGSSGTAVSFPVTGPTPGTAPRTVPPYFTPEMFSDYLWTSMYLFGEYNGPQWSGRYQASETDINAVQPQFFRLPIATHNFGRESAVYHDTWMNHAGIGTSKIVVGQAGKICCGLSLSQGPTGVILQSLAGGMKGGLYICTDNGYWQATGYYEPFLGTLWEDQFWAPTVENYTLRPKTAVYHWNLLNTYDDLGLLHDVWVDGDIEQNTTDVIFGTWSITLISDFSKDKVALTWQEKNRLRYATYNYGAANDVVASWTFSTPGSSTAPLTTSNDDYEDLMETIKGAAVKLDKNVRFTSGTSTAGDEIYDVKIRNRFDVPMITPYFALAYGLANYGR